MESVGTPLAYTPIHWTLPIPVSLRGAIDTELSSHASDPPSDEAGGAPQCETHGQAHHLYYGDHQHIAWGWEGRVRRGRGRGKEERRERKRDKGEGGRGGRREEEGREEEKGERDIVPYFQKLSKHVTERLF